MTAHPRRRRIGEWLADRVLRGIARAAKKEAPARKVQGLLSTTMPAPRPERKGQTHAGY